MLHVREWLRRLSASFRRNARDAEMEEELQLHLELTAEEMRRRGGSAEDAARIARIQAGGVAQTMEVLRDQRGLPWVADLIQDVRHGSRSLRRTPAFTTVALVTLACAIGANTAVFSLLDVLLLRDLPVREPNNLVQLLWTYPGDPPLNVFSVENYEYYRDHNSVFSEMLGTAVAHVESRSTAGRPELRPGPAAIGTESLGVECVTGNFFTALGVRSAAGRLLSEGDNRPGAPPVAVVSWTYWSERLNRNPDILGTNLMLADVPVTVIGVASQTFFGVAVGYQPDVWTPATVCQRKGRPGLAIMARLKEGVSIDRARAEMRVLDLARIEAFARKDPRWRETTFDVLPARAGLSTPVDQQFARPLWVLMAIVAVLLLLASANLGSLLLARGAARSREMAVRVSLGAGRLRIVRQVFTESLLLAIAGGLLGIVAAYIAVPILLRITTSGTRMIGVPPRLEVTIDLRILIFTLGAMVAAAVLFGLVPALGAFASAPAAALREATGAGQPRSRGILGNALVVAQVALSVVLLSVSTLYVRHLSELRGAHLGFDRTSVLLVALDASATGQSREVLAQRYSELLNRFESIPGVRSATLSGMTPLSGAAGSAFVTVEGFHEEPQARRRVNLNGVAPKYFETWRTPLIAGRDFQWTDEGRQRVAIVNQAAVRYYFPATDPVGKHLQFDGSSQAYEIVGVVADAKYNDVRVPAPRTIYLHFFQQNRMPANFALRTTGPPRAVAGDVRRIVNEVLGNAALANVTTLAEQVDASIVPERLIATLSSFFGGVGMFLAAIGLYGLLAYSVARRTREIGVRMALGARGRDVTFVVLRRALALVGAGLIVGAPAAVWSKRIAATMVGNLPAGSPMPIVIATLVTIVVALLAAYLPARRATHVDPLIALRSE